MKEAETRSRQGREQQRKSETEIKRPRIEERERQQEA